MRRNDGSFAPYATILNVREIYQLVRPKANHPVLWHPELNAGKLEIVSVRLLTAGFGGKLEMGPRKIEIHSEKNLFRGFIPFADALPLTLFNCKRRNTSAWTARFWKAMSD